MPLLILYGTAEELQKSTGRIVLPANEASARLGVSDARLRQLVAEGLIQPVARFAKANLYLEDDVNRVKIARDSPVGP